MELRPTGAGLAAFAFAWTLVALSAQAQTVTDGDTIKLNDKRVRLRGIDAPEIHQECNGWLAGIEAARKMRELGLRLAGGLAHP